ncbi:hypothetical protein M407DRAFT_17962 [Tulasnella calospora MUT 4182]|uniref:F-box domain-containing protein n=1 Tax=Tulasnella calospora MUT 4182 TaxID=1051891 RepID=A0A0C3QKM2_9AGAM|nr:hypothetical protein M407DRAFT_17962 [Tulasnella calospora MUT 4182]
MVTTRGKKIKFDLDTSEVEFDDERDVERPAKPALKRRKTKKSKSGEEDSAFTPGSSPGKRKGKATLIQNQLITRRSGRGGKLRDLMNMPVDIFTEICSYLEPHDLRRLALTSKRLWDILMTKEVRHIWKTALTSVPDLPECPTDLNEPQYVCLLYSSECYTIGCTSRGTKADWFHRVRFCSTCYQPKMTGEWTLRHSWSRVELGLKDRTLSQIQEYFNSRHAMRSYSFRRGYYVEALKKAGTKYEALSEEEAEKYLSSLKERREYRIETGRAMREWKNRQLSSRADDIAAEKGARLESIEAKLLEMGWEREDFPMSNKEFKDLVLKDQKLTPKIWQNIRWKLESLLETSRNERLEGEKRQRRRNRESAICNFYRQIVRETMGLPFKHSRVGSILPAIEDILALPSIKPLLEADTETVTEGQWIEVAADVRYIVVKWWRDTLERLVQILEHDTAARPNEANNGDEGTVNSNSENETEEAILGSIEALSTKLSYATSVFGCTDPHHKKMFWFPHNIKHGLSCHSCSSMSELLDQLRPLDSNGQHLVQRLLADLELDPETVRSSEVVLEDQNQKKFLCTRCDESVARYMDLNDLIEHYLDHQKWFDDVKKAVRDSPDSCYPFQAVNSELPKIVNDHDWVSHDALLARQDNKERKEAVLKLQRSFRREELTDPLSETEGSDSVWSMLGGFVRRERTCMLCPTSYSPHPCSTRRIELHIRSKHDKVPDLKNDTTLEIFSLSNPCPS